MQKKLWKWLTPPPLVKKAGVLNQEQGGLMMSHFDLRVAPSFIVFEKLRGMFSPFWVSTNVLEVKKILEEAKDSS